MKNKILKNLKVLLVEDEEKLSILLKKAIGESFYSFSVAKDGEEGFEKFLTISPDIVITDIMMPRLTGLEMATKIREINSGIPIIILSAYSESDKFLGAIDIGVVKYFIKPFDPDELLEYIESVGEKLGSRVIELCDGFTYNLTTQALYKNSRYLSLSKKECSFIQLLVQNSQEPKKKIVDENKIKKNLWGEEEISSERLRTFIKRLRAKTAKNLVLNQKGEGYKINLSPDNIKCL